jgi:magnesium chelatase family protein
MLKKRRVARVRQIQIDRQGTTNAVLAGEDLLQALSKDTECCELIETADKRFGLSMRGITRVLRVARSIADLAGVADINASHVSESLAYRQRFVR